MKKKIMVTGGAGYIGSHTIVELINGGYDVISIDNFSRSTPQILDGIKTITGYTITNYAVDLCNEEDLTDVFQQEQDVAGIIHFAAYKMVGESVEQPLKYYENNLCSLIHVLRSMESFNINNLIFSSSCSVYGNLTSLPVTEDTPNGQAESPYAATKQMGERIVGDFLHAAGDKKGILLRYFNPVGAHPSAEIGELPIGKPNNLVPVITQTAIGKQDGMCVWGSDYNTRDGSCIRDYIHVMDIARAHTQAMDYLLEGKNQTNCEVYNVGSGRGVTVLEAIRAFETVSGVKLNYTLGPRRPGDVVAIFADNQRIRQRLGWEARYDLDEMMRSAWKWEQRQKERG